MSLAVPLLGSASGGSFLLSWGQADVKILAVERVGLSCLLVGKQYLLD